mgnify:CR=1 FL=1
MGENNEFNGSFLKPPAPRPQKIIAIQPDATALELFAMMLVLLHGHPDVVEYDVKITSGDIRHFAALAERHFKNAA